MSYKTGSLPLPCADIAAPVPGVPGRVQVTFHDQALVLCAHTRGGKHQLLQIAQGSLWVLKTETDQRSVAVRSVVPLAQCSQQRP